MPEPKSSNAKRPEKWRGAHFQKALFPLFFREEKLQRHVMPARAVIQLTAESLSQAILELLSSIHQ